jgi:uncharacterized membrane protein
MELFFIPAYLFLIGSTAGWVIELLFRRFFSSANPERKWINPGLCTGPYLPLYGCGLCVLYLLSSLGELPLLNHPVWNKVVLYLCMAAGMTAIEYVAGLFSLKVAKVRLWDYSKQWGNLQGIICPKFSLAWAAIGVLYDLLLHPHIRVLVRRLSQTPAFLFFLGMFFGVFLVDFIHATNLLRKLKRFAWDGTNETSFDDLLDGETFRDNDNGTVTVGTGALPLPASELLPIPMGVKAV